MNQSPRLKINLECKFWVNHKIYSEHTNQPDIPMVPIMSGIGRSPRSVKIIAKFHPPSRNNIRILKIPVILAAD